MLFLIRSLGAGISPFDTAVMKSEFEAVKLSVRQSSAKLMDAGVPGVGGFAAISAGFFHLKFMFLCSSDTRTGSTKLPSLNRRTRFVESSNLFDGSAIDLRLITLYCRITSLTVWLRAERNERLVMSYLSSRSLPCTGIDGTKAIIVFEASELRKMPPVKNSAFDVLSKSSIRELNPVGLWLALSLSLSGPRFRFRASSGLSLLSLPVLAALVPG